MQKQVTIMDVAQAAGVSPGTVSRVLNKREGDIKISEATQRRVLDAAEKLGYQANPFAAALRTQQTGVIGAIVRDITDPFLALLLRHIQYKAHHQGYDLLAGYADFDVDTAKRQFKFMLNHWFDGLLFLGNLSASDRSLLELNIQSTPLVAVACGLDQMPFAVNIDDAQGARIALDYLYQLGHRRIAFMGYLEPAGVKDRLRVFREYVKKYDLTCPQGYERLLPGNTRSDAIQNIHALHSLPEPPTAILCSSDFLALAAMNGAWQRGWKIPEQVSIIGFDDIEASSDAYPPLTTIRQPVDEMADQAMMMVVNLIKRQDVPAKAIVQPELVVRGSCGPVSAG